MACSSFISGVVIALVVRGDFKMFQKTSLVIFFISKVAHAPFNDFLLYP